MKVFASLISMLLLFTSTQGQVLDPVKWQQSFSSDNFSRGSEIELIITADIDKDWYLYSTDFDPDLGPIVTEFSFTENASYELNGGIRPIGSKEKYDELWEGNYTYFKKTAEFRQPITILDENFEGIEGSVSYQVCSDISGKCIPFTKKFKVSTNKQTEPSAGQSKIKAGEQVTTATETQANSGLFAFFLAAFGGGLLALMTPCVYPMIPMTVAFFTKQEKNQNRSKSIQTALFYGVSVVLIYTMIGTIVSALFGPAFANWLSTHWLPNILFFLIFTVFALSFFGMFEIVLPASWVNKADRQSDRGGFAGAFFMAFTLALVSFSCTGPIAGSVLVAAAGGEIIKPVIGMFGYSLAFAVPFTLFAVFPSWLNSLPKSGGWLNSVKVVLGFLELAFAFKFLSVADQVYHWNILDREIYLAIWIVIFSLMGFYLLGKIRLPHDSKMENIPVPRFMLAVATFTFVVYLIPGLFGAQLKSMAGYLPPMHTHDFNVPLLIAEQVEASQEFNNAGQPQRLLSSTPAETCEEPRFGEFLDFPHGIEGYFDYNQALACAKAQNKPVFIDFTGHGCVNCREMEAAVWSDPAVLKRLKTDFVVLALYVDDKKKLPEEEWYTSAYDNKVKKTIGAQNADFQISRFNNNAQPYYVLLNTNGELLVEPKAYDLNAQRFANFLDKGKQHFKEGITREETLAKR